MKASETVKSNEAVKSWMTLKQKTRASESVDGWLNAGSSESVKASEIASQTVKSQVAPGDNPQAPRMMTPRL